MCIRDSLGVDGERIGAGIAVGHRSRMVEAAPARNPQFQRACRSDIFARAKRSRPPTADRRGRGRRRRLSMLALGYLEKLADPRRETADLGEELGDKRL